MITRPFSSSDNMPQQKQKRNKRNLTFINVRVYFLLSTPSLLPSFFLTFLLHVYLAHAHILTISHAIYLQVDPYANVAINDSMGEDGQKACVVAATMAERICSGTYIIDCTGLDGALHFIIKCTNLILVSWILISFYALTWQSPQFLPTFDFVNIACIYLLKVRAYYTSLHRKISG